MTRTNHIPEDLDGLLEALCEERLSADEAPRLEQLIISSPEARWRYLAYLDLHGTLYWNTAGVGVPEPLSSDSLTDFSQKREYQPVNRTSPRNVPQMVGAVTVCLISAMFVAWQVSRPMKSTVAVTANHESGHAVGTTVTNPVRRSAPRSYGPPISLEDSENPATHVSATEPQTDVQDPSETRPSIPTLSTSEIVTQINLEIQSRWTATGLHPSAIADDSEWLRRSYLNLSGRIPTVPEAEAFLTDPHAEKRAKLIDQLLDDSGYVRNFTIKWTNLLIGRSSHPQVDREAFQKFLRLSFARNRPWNQIVADLISAEGNNSENGATNFLIAHLNNDATPATAVAAKLFLGRQVQCNQCHNNPFDETKQLAFWELNSFFQQTASVSRLSPDSRPEHLSRAITELITQDAGGPIYFETQNGLMRVAYPRFNGHAIDPSPDTNRRRELARLMTAGEQPQLAAAFINRMWEHFFGAGFTRSVDDMGSHQPVSHPELLAMLSQQFIRNDYDIKQLIRWICLSEPYHLSSRFSDSNQSDDPVKGELPSFSRMYVKSMSAEQTYDSLLTATKAHQVGAVDWAQAEQIRQQWLQQFIVTFHTDDNDETMSFDGSIGNALSLMNGPLIGKALDLSAGSFLGEIIRRRTSDNEKLRTLLLASFSRPPDANEMSRLKNLLPHARTDVRQSSYSPEAYQDLYWAFLNSNEFILIR